MRAYLSVFFVLVLSPGTAAAQHDHLSPYAPQARSEIPSLTPQELADLESAAGMGLARAAELNHYPGPRHVLELADSLQLGDAQRDDVVWIQEAMRDRAVELGNAIIETERDLNRRFRHAQVDSATVRDLTGRIARLYGELRYTHLAAHLATRRVLRSDQVAVYDRLRGYSAD